MKFVFEIGQMVERVYGQKEYNDLANLMRQFFKDESVIKEMVELVPRRDGDLFKVCEQRVLVGKNGVEYDLYLCQKLETQEFTLFGRSGLREHICS